MVRENQEKIKKFFLQCQKKMEQMPTNSPLSQCKNTQKTLLKKHNVNTAVGLPSAIINTARSMTMHYQSDSGDVDL